MTILLAIMKYMSSPKSAAVKNIDVDIAHMLGQKYQYPIDIGHGNIDPNSVNIGKNIPGKNHPGKNHPGKNHPGKNHPSKNHPVITLYNSLSVVCLSQA